MKNYNFSYDKDNDDLFIFEPAEKSKASVEIGDLILDLNHKKELVGLQIMNASKFIKDLVVEEELNNVEVVLKSIKDCKLSIKTKNNLLIIHLCLIGNKKEIKPILSVPKIKETSSSLAWA